MGFFDKIKAGLFKTKDKLVHEIKRIVSRSPKLTSEAIEELEAGKGRKFSSVADLLAEARD